MKRHHDAIAKGLLKPFPTYPKLNLWAKGRVVSIRFKGRRQPFAYPQWILDLRSLQFSVKCKLMNGLVDGCGGGDALTKRYESLLGLIHILLCCLNLAIKECRLIATIISKRLTLPLLRIPDLRLRLCNMFVRRGRGFAIVCPVEGDPVVPG